VANQWRRFNYRIVDTGQGGALPQNQLIDADAFNISTVSVEENGLAVASGTTPKIPYI